MIAVEEARVVPMRRILLKQPTLQNRSTVPVSRRLLYISPVKSQPRKEEEDIPMDKWIMPPQPQGYLKGTEYDFF